MTLCGGKLKYVCSYSFMIVNNWEYILIRFDSLCYGSSTRDWVVPSRCCNCKIEVKWEIITFFILTAALRMLETA